MNHEEATKYLDRLGDQVPDRRPPVGDIICAGKVAERRRSQRTLGLTAAAAVLVVAGGWTIQQWATDDSAGIGRSIANSPPTDTLPEETPVGGYECPPAPASTRAIDPSTVPVPDDATGLAANEAGTVAAWFEPTSGPLPFLVVYDVAADAELAREDLGMGEDRRSSSLRVDGNALYYRSSADPNVWLRYRWGVDDYPSVYAICSE